MSKLEWDVTGTRVYETGISKCVLYKKDTTTSKWLGTAWSGITAISEAPSGADETTLYADGIKYLTLRGLEELGISIEAYTYPDEWATCDGSATIGGGLLLGQQKREKFGLSYRTEVGNDEHEDLGYKIHLIWNCSASPSDRSYQTINDSPEAISFSWDVTTTTQVIGDNYKSASSITIDTTKLTNGKSNTALATLEGYLYGTNATYAEATGISAFASGTDYYTKSGDTYTKITTSGDNAVSFDSNTTYYTQTAAATDAYLPTMAEVIALFTPAG